MPRPKSLAELERERGRLTERIAAQRATLASQFVPVAHLLQFGDRVAQTAQRVRQFVLRHPVAMASAGAVLLLRRPRKLGRWVRRSLLLWRSWRTVRQLARTVQRQLDKAAGGAYPPR
ncbi:YqjK family protein [Pseudorhodoferax sp.]|uniref:YqjK family protein n=1 Tax=Pseudorhodoferax sp. TaxID=1993553 RepID=UPI0039E5D80B